MIWFYQRGNQHLYYEVRLRDDGPGYELSLASPEGPLLTERFLTDDALTCRFTELRAALIREGWGPLRESPLECGRPIGQRASPVIRQRPALKEELRNHVP